MLERPAEQPVGGGELASPPMTPRSQAESRPGWVKVARVTIAAMLMPVALCLAAWPLAVAGGYRLCWMDTGAMYPAIPEGKLMLLMFRTDIAPRVGKVYAVRVGTREGGTALLKVRRVVALEGDTVSLEDGRLVRNGRAAEEAYAHVTPGGVDPLPRSEADGPMRISLHDGSKATVEVVDGAVMIPEGYVMVLPDDRSTIRSTTEAWLIRRSDVYAEVLGP